MERRHCVGERTCWFAERPDFHDLRWTAFGVLRMRLDRKPPRQPLPHQALLGTGDIVLVRIAGAPKGRVASVLE